MESMIAESFSSARISNHDEASDDKFCIAVVVYEMLFELWTLRSMVS